MNTFVAKERLYRLADGTVTSEAQEGASLAAAQGDEFPMDEAKRLGLTGDKPNEEEFMGPSHLAATARADAQRLKAAEAQLEQHEALAAESSATDAQQQRALADEKARAAEAERTAAISEKRHEDAKQAKPSRNKQAGRGNDK